MRIIIFITALLISVQTLACPSYQLVDNGDKVPCKGLFLNQSTNEYVKKDLRDNEIRKKQIELKDLQLTEITTDRDNWKSEASKQAELRHRKDNNLRNGMLIGAAAALLSIFLVKKASE
jgi:hypothetical protein